jgi:large conductance mechanosensitive channel
MFKEFKEFALKGNVLDLAVGIVIGAAFITIVNSLVADVVMPPIGLLLGKADFSNLFLVLREGKMPGPYPTLSAAKAAGAVSVNIGLFINAIISFFIVVFAVFMIVKGFIRLRRQNEAAQAPVTKKDCPWCLSAIPLGARRCPHCTSNLEQ